MLLKTLFEEVELEASKRNIAESIIDYFNQLYQESMVLRPGYYVCDHYRTKKQYVFAKLAAHKVKKMLTHDYQIPDIFETRFNYLSTVARELRTKYREKPPCGFCSVCVQGKPTKVRVPGCCTKINPIEFAPKPLFQGVLQ